MERKIYRVEGTILTGYTVVTLYVVRETARYWICKWSSDGSDENVRRVPKKTRDTPNKLEALEYIQQQCQKDTRQGAELLGKYVQRLKQVTKEINECKASG